MHPGNLIVEWDEGGTDYCRIYDSTTDTTATFHEEYDDTTYASISNSYYEPLALPDDFDLPFQMQREAILEKTLDLRDYLRIGDSRRYFLRSCAVAALANRENLKRSSNQIRAPNHRDL
jgi:hypothetical protein